MGKPGFEITDCNAHAPGAEIEGQNRSASRRVMEGGGWAMGGFRAFGFQLITHHSTLGSGVAGLLGKAGKVDAEELHGGRQPFFGGNIKNDIGLGLHGQPRVLRQLVL